MDNTSLATQISGASASPMAVALPSTLSSNQSHLARSPCESSHKTLLLPARVMPDLANCRAKPAGFADYADCLAEHGSQCQHALGFGHGYLCQHPQRNEIILRTSACNQQELAGKKPTSLQRA